jgi:lysophospholipase L1-like esterase
MVGVASLALVALLTGEIVVAANRTYLVDVDFAVDAVVGSTDGRRPLELRVLGDSTAAGVGTDGEVDALPVLLASRVAERIGRPVHVVGLGASGARTDDVRADQLPRLDTTADVIVVVVGSNNVIHPTTPGRMRAATIAMLRRAAQTGAPVVLGGVPRFLGVGALPQPLRELVDGYAGVMREAQRDAARQVPGVSFVDIAALASPRFLGRPEAMSSDRFHPSTVGYGFWADALAPAVVAAAT